MNAEGRTMSDLIKKICAAFDHRPLPAVAADDTRPFITDRQEAARLNGKYREELDWHFLQKNSDALYAMTPEAFRYYLPKFLVLALQGGDTSPLFISPVVMMLDPGPDETYWDVDFRRKWLGMTAAEYCAVAEWVVYMASNNRGDWDDIALARAFDTVQRLSQSALIG
jgi:hypothetical protein